MFGSNVLEVATGLVFVYLLMALACSEIGNKVSEWLNWRASDLEKGLREILLNGDIGTLKNIYDSFHIQPLMIPDSRVTKWLRGMGMDRYIFKWQGGDKSPIDIPARTFALAVFDAVVPGAAGTHTLHQWRNQIATTMQDSPLKKMLLDIADKTTKTVDDARTSIEELYNRAEDQMTAIYKQNMWGFAVLFGLGLSIFFNVDSVAIGDRLWHDQALRTTVVSAAQDYQKRASDAEKTSQEEAAKLRTQATAELQKLNLPVGWQANSQTDFPWVRITPNDWTQTPRATTTLGWLRDFIIKILGWVVTAIAAAQGAPFWFDILRKLTQKPSAATP